LTSSAKRTASSEVLSLSIDGRGSLKLMTVVGARPQFVKAAALSRAIAAARTDERDGMVEVLVHTVQHYDYQMSDVFFDELQIAQPDYQLGIGSADHGAQTGAMMARLEEAVSEVKPDIVLVFGDTNSTLAAALVAAKKGIRLAHVEAGLRSFDRSMPEEINRVVTDHVADLLYCPSNLSVAQLRAEGIAEGVEMVGDVMFDIFRAVQGRLPAENSVTSRLHVEDGYLLVTLHRPVNTEDPAALRRICDAFSILAAAGHTIVWPVHPRLRGRLADLVSRPEVHLLEPVGYLEMLMLLRGCSTVVTDSGGLQKEALWSQKPCITMRTTSEWMETIDAGWNVLVGNDVSSLVEAAEGCRPTGTPPAIYGDGNASIRIVESLVRHGPSVGTSSA
jgi:UDP-N-acetylglucosamine 2-epimerase